MSTTLHIAKGGTTTQMPMRDVKDFSKAITNPSLTGTARAVVDAADYQQLLKDLPTLRRPFAVAILKVK